jgi:hypothetical protein
MSASEQTIKRCVVKAHALSISPHCPTQPHLSVITAAQKPQLHQVPKISILFLHLPLQAQNKSENSRRATKIFYCILPRFDPRVRVSTPYFPHPYTSSILLTSFSISLGEEGRSDSIDYPFPFSITQYHHLIPLHLPPPEL